MRTWSLEIVTEHQGTSPPQHGGLLCGALEMRSQNDYESLHLTSVCLFEALDCAVDALVAASRVEASSLRPPNAISIS